MWKSLLCLPLLALATSALAAPTGVALTPDQNAILVSKDIGGARWAITFNTGADVPTVTGNVFPTDGGEPAFVYCVPFRVDGTPDDVANAVFHFACSGNTACHPGNCPSWTSISQDVALPGSFFLPK